MATETALYINVAAVMALENERLRNFILCTPLTDRLTLGILERGAPDLFNHEPSPFPIPLSALIIATFGELLTQDELTEINSRDGLRLETGCGRFNLPITLAFADWGSGDDEEPWPGLLRTDAEQYADILRDMSEAELNKFHDQPIGATFNWNHNDYAIIGKGWSCTLILLAPAALIDTNS